MSKKRLKRLILSIMDAFWVDHGLLFPATAVMVAEDLNVSRRLARKALRELVRAGQLQQCPDCGMHYLSDRRADDLLLSVAPIRDKHLH